MTPIGLSLPALPREKTVTVVLADFLAYLFRCTRDYIQEAHANGASLWQSMHENVRVVLSHPNGWEGYQQTKMREAAVLAGLVPDSDAGKARLHFVTEGEASLHYCVNSGLASEVIKVIVSMRRFSLSSIADMMSGLIGWRECYDRRLWGWYDRLDHIQIHDSKPHISGGDCNS